MSKLDRKGAKTARSPPDQHVLTRLEIMRRVAKQHPVGGGQRQGVAGAFLPGQMLGARHQLLRLHAGELRKGSVRRLVAPDPLGGRKHRIAPVAFLVVAIILIAMDDDLVADLPALDLVPNLPDDPRSIGPRDVIGRAVAVERADRLTQTRPDPVIVDAGRHHQDQHLVAVDLPGIDHLDLKALVGLAMPLATNGPGIHLLGHIPQRRHFTDLVEILFGCIIGRDAGVCIQSHDSLLSQIAAMQNRFTWLRNTDGRVILQYPRRIFCNFMTERVQKICQSVLRSQKRWAIEAA